MPKMLSCRAFREYEQRGESAGVMRNSSIHLSCPRVETELSAQCRVITSWLKARPDTNHLILVIPTHSIENN